MGVPTSEVGYTSAMPRREDHEVHKDMWGHWGKYIYIKFHYIYIYKMELEFRTAYHLSLSQARLIQSK